MDIFVFIYLLTLHVVNTAMYFAVTRVAHGWTKTLLGLFAYFSFVVLHMMLVPRVGVSPSSFAPYGFPLGFGSWLVATVAMSRPDSRSAAYFVGILCGAHQLVVSVACYALMRHARFECLSKPIASVLMLCLGAGVIWFVLPRVRRLSQFVDWRILNAAVTVLLALVYVTGFCPVWAADGPWREAVPFLVAVLTLVFFFPLVFQLSEKSRAAARLALAENNVRLMADEMRTRRAAIDEARRVRHDRRHHCAAIAELLRAKNYDRALTYVEELDADLQGAATALVWCENETVNAILSGCLRKAIAEHVTLVAEASVPRQMAFSDVELVAVLSNLIENAIRATGKMQAPDPDRGPGGDGDRSVRVQLAYPNGILRFRVSNAVPEGFVLRGGWPCETPGIGLKVVRAVIERHGGGLDFVLEGNRLTARGFLSCVRPAVMPPSS